MFSPSGSSCPGASPWFKAYSSSKIDHFYTMFAPERDNAVTSLGYSSEGIAAYIVLESNRNIPVFFFHLSSIVPVA